MCIDSLQQLQQASQQCKNKAASRAPFRVMIDFDELDEARGIAAVLASKPSLKKLIVFSNQGYTSKIPQTTR